MQIIDRLLGRDRKAIQDAERLYHALLAQSRNPAFYGGGKTPDSYDGRVEILSMHMSIVLKALRALGEQGERLAQALFDAMVDDFDIALREEGLTDKGVARRIKPIVELVYARLKHYDNLGASEPPKADLKSGVLGDVSSEFAGELAAYFNNLNDEVKEKSLRDFAVAKIAFPNIS